MSTTRLLQVFFVRLLPLLVLGLVGVRAMAQADPPSRVARVNHAEGPVVFSQAGDNEWIDAVLNRPLSRGDRVWTDKGSRAELQVGSSAVRLNGLTQLEILALDDQAAQLSVTQGSVHVRVRSLPEGENFEIDTPNLAYRAAYPGEYRVDVDGVRGTTRVTVLSGTGAVYGEAGQVLPLGAGQQITFRDRGLAQVAVQESPPQDNFDRWSADRSRREDQSVSARYVPREVVGYQQLDAHGQWAQDATYGAVWFPQGTPANWAPYRNGHWEWMSPWGWTWIDDAPWGFAPFHYGRWAMIGSRWAWAPGRLGLKPVYAPALVAFVGTGNSTGWNIPLISGRPAVAWFPLAPGEVWQPGYRASPVYMSNLNQNLVLQANPTYANQRKVEALTSVSAADFHRGKPARAGWLRIASNTLASAQVVPPPAMPERTGLTENQRTVAAASKAIADAAGARQAEAAEREAIRRKAEAQAHEAARVQQAQAQAQAAQAQAAAQAAAKAQEAARALRTQQAPRDQQQPREAKAETPLLAKWLQRLGIMATSTTKPAAVAPPSTAAASVAKGAAPARAAVKAKAVSPTTAAPEAAPRTEQARVEQSDAEEQARREKLARRAEQAKREQVAKRAEQAKREQLAAKQAELARREQVAKQAAEQAKREQLAQREQTRREQAKREQVARQAEQAKREQLAKRAEQLRREQVAKQAEQARREAVARREEQQRKELHAQHVEQARRAADRDAQALREQRAQREEQQARREAQERELAQQREQAQRAAWARQQQALAEQWRRDHQAWEQQQQQQQYRARGGRPDLRDDRRSRGIPIIAGPTS